MEKQLLTSIIEKYYLNGIHEKVKWVIKDKKVQIQFTSPTMDLCGMVEASEFDIDNCILGIYDTNKLLKLVGITNQFLTLNVEVHNNTATKLLIADNEYDLTYHLADLRMIPIETMVLDESQVTFNYSFVIDQELTERYIRAKKALGSDEVKIHAMLNENQEKTIYFILGGKTSHDNKINFYTPADKIELSPNSFSSPLFIYNADYIQEIFVENKEAEGRGWFDDNGILKLEFTDKRNIKSTYYLPPKE